MRLWKGPSHVLALTTSTPARHCQGQPMLTSHSTQKHPWMLGLSVTQGAVQRRGRTNQPDGTCLRPCGLCRHIAPLTLHHQAFSSLITYTSMPHTGLVLGKLAPAGASSRT